MNRRQRRALFADTLGWNAKPPTGASWLSLSAAAKRGDADLDRWLRRRRSQRRREVTPGATARSRRLARQRWLQGYRKQLRRQR